MTQANQPLTTPSTSGFTQVGVAARWGGRKGGAVVQGKIQCWSVPSVCGQPAHPCISRCRWPVSPWHCTQVRYCEDFYFTVTVHNYYATHAQNTPLLLKTHIHTHIHIYKQTNTPLSSDTHLSCYTHTSLLLHTHTYTLFTHTVLYPPWQGGVSSSWA